MKSLKLPNNEYFSIYMQIGENNDKQNCFSRIMDKYSSAPDSVCTTHVKKILVTMFAWSLFMLRGVLCAMMCPLILTHDPYRGLIGNF